VLPLQSVGDQSAVMLHLLFFSMYRGFNKDLQRPSSNKHTTAQVAPYKTIHSEDDPHEAATLGGCATSIPDG